MTTEYKTWGIARELFNNGGVRVVLISGNAGKGCGFHHHKFLYNAFHVVTGGLRVLEKRAYEFPHLLLADESHMVSPKTIHRFEFTENNTLAVEIYWPASLVGDITRTT